MNEIQLLFETDAGRVMAEMKRRGWTMETKIVFSQKELKKNVLYIEATATLFLFKNGVEASQKDFRRDAREIIENL